MNTSTTEDRVRIDGDIHHLREDNTIHLGPTILYRAMGSRKWIETTVDGRATMIPGISYETMISVDDVSSPPSLTSTIMRKLYLFFTEWLI